ncbi:MAG: ester cyclase [Firmicutes bacterium]|nr:ester cyclase [Bacillota bacterium]
MDKKDDNKNIKNMNKKPEKTDKKMIYYGDSSLVNSLKTHDYSSYIELEGKKKQEMKGFDSEYNDFVDFIMKITHNIWEKKGIGIIYDTYSANVIVHTPAGTNYGVYGVISGTLQTLHSFPDRKLLGQNVIWSNGDDGSLVSSHRIQSISTNYGDNSYGKATGKKVSFRTVAECIAKNNKIYEEWLVRDNLWIVKQLGYDPDEIAKKLAKASKDKEPALQSKFGLGESMEGQIKPELYNAKDSSVGELVLEMISHIWNCKLINEVEKYYHENAVNHFICDMDLNGYDNIQGMFVSLFASFPNAAIEVERISCNQREENSWDVAVRWRLNGVHEGYGYFGKPSGKRIEVLGINHYNIVDNKVKEEWMTFDGLEVLRQMYLNEVDEDTEINEL